MSLTKIIPLITYCTLFITSCEQKDLSRSDEQMIFLNYYLDQHIKSHLTETNELMNNSIVIEEDNEEFRRDTDSLVKYLDSIKNALISASGGYEDEFVGILKNPNNEAIINQMFYNKESEKFQQRLEQRIINYDKKYSPINLHYLNGMYQDPYYSKLPDSAKKSFVELLIGQNSNLIFCLQSLSMWQTFILTQEQRYYIEKLNKASN